MVIYFICYDDQQRTLQSDEQALQSLKEQETCEIEKERMKKKKNEKTKQPQQTIDTAHTLHNIKRTVVWENCLNVHKPLTKDKTK